MNLVYEIIAGFVEMRLKEDPKTYLFPDAIANRLRLSQSVVVEALEKLVAEKKIVKRNSYECWKERAPLKESKKVLSKVFCIYCGRNHSIDRETLHIRIVYRGKQKKKEEGKQ